MNNGLVLSIFPGIDLLGRAFEEEGYTIVRGPDVIWGGDIRTFHPPAGVFEGMIGGPPCQAFSALRHLIRHNGHEPRFGNLIPEYERAVFEAQPAWFLMENVPDAPVPKVEGYDVYWLFLTDQQAGGVQPRKRRFSFGSRDGRMLYLPHHEVGENSRSDTVGTMGYGIMYEGSGRTRRSSVMADGRTTPVKMLKGGKQKRSITSAGGGAHGGGRGEGWEDGRLPGGAKRSVSPNQRVFSAEQARRSAARGGGTLPGTGSHTDIADACEAMGLPRDFTDHMPFTMHGKRSVIGNGVPMAMGRAVAQAVRRATA